MQESFWSVYSCIGKEKKVSFYYSKNFFGIQFFASISIGHLFNVFARKSVDCRRVLI